MLRKLGEGGEVETGFPFSCWRKKEEKKKIALAKGEKKKKKGQVFSPPVAREGKREEKEIRKYFFSFDQGKPAGGKKEEKGKGA